MKPASKRTSIVAAVLAFVFGASSCSYLMPNKITTSKILDYYEDSRYDEVDIDEIIDKYEDLYYATEIDEDLKNGVYTLATSSNEIKSMFRDYDDLNLFQIFGMKYDKHMEQACWFTRVEESNNFNSINMITVASIQFESSSDARDYVTDISEYVEDVAEDVESGDLEGYDDYEIDSGKEGFMGYVLIHYDLSNTDTDMYCGMYLQGRYLLVVIGADLDSTKAKREIESICDSFGILCPTSL